MNFIWEALIILPTGVLLLRIAGKKTVAEMTSLEIITTLGIGTLISHAILEEGLVKTVAAMAIIVFFLIVTQYIQLKSGWFEKIFIGRATLVVDEGHILHQNLKKLRMTSRQLEMRLRQLGINNVLKVRSATIEANGQLGYELFPQYEPLTYARYVELIQNEPGTKQLPLINKEELKAYNLFKEYK